MGMGLDSIGQANQQMISSAKNRMVAQNGVSDAANEKREQNIAKTISTPPPGADLVSQALQGRGAVMDIQI